MTDTRASVGIMAAAALPAMIGIAAFSIELGQGYQAKIAYQGIADVAALAAANAYSSTKSDTTLSATALNVANMNGVASANVTVTHLTNYSATVSDAVQVVLTRTVPVYFARIFQSQASYTVSVTSVASLATSSTPACVIALSTSGSGVSLSGGTRLTAPQCAIASNNAISVSGGSTISAKATTTSTSVSVDGGSSITADPVIYGSSVSVTGGSSISGTQTHKSNSTADPLADNTALAAAQALLGTYTAPTTPTVPTGADMSPGYYPTTMTFQGYTGTSRAAHGPFRRAPIISITSTPAA
jgi:Flp pilus assembly protein TadG